MSLRSICGMLILSACFSCGNNQPIENTVRTKDLPDSSHSVKYTDSLLGDTLTVQQESDTIPLVIDFEEIRGEWIFPDTLTAGDKKTKYEGPYRSIEITASELVLNKKDQTSVRLPIISTTYTVPTGYVIELASRVKWCFSTVKNEKEIIWMNKCCDDCENYRLKKATGKV